MKWVLIVWLVYGSGIGRNATAIDVEFHTRDACEAAGQKVVAEAQREFKGNPPARYVCVERGEEPARQ